LSPTQQNVSLWPCQTVGAACPREGTECHLTAFLCFLYGKTVPHLTVFFLVKWCPTQGKEGCSVNYLLHLYACASGFISCKTVSL
jgi:hypothetical protein